MHHVHDSGVGLILEEVGMSKLIVLASDAKGGVGKSTIAIHLAGAYAHQGKRVLLVDTDIGPSGQVKKKLKTKKEGSRTTSTWVLQREALISSGEYPDIPDISYQMLHANHDIRKNINAQLEIYDVVIIDTPADGDEALESVLMKADQIIVPMNLSAQEFEPLETLIQTIKQAERMADSQGIDIKIPVTALATKIDSKWTRPWEAFDDWYNDYAHQYVSVFQVVIPYLRLYIDSVTTGLSVYDYPKWKSRESGRWDRLIAEIEGRRSLRYVRTNELESVE
jgi:cellulose biosynthesis protein BcsQ